MRKRIAGATVAVQLVAFLTACQSTPASPATCPCQAAPAPDQPVVVQPNPSPSPAPGKEREANGITDPEGPRPGETPEAEQAAITAAFDAQPFDEPWRSVTEGKFRQAFVDHPGEVSLVEVECRQTLCKLTVLRQTGKRKKTLHGIVARGASEEDGFIGSFSFTRHASRGDPMETVYVSRNHYTLPDKHGKVTALPKRRPTP